MPDLVLLIEETPGYVVGHQLVPAQWAKKYISHIQALFQLCSRSVFQYESAETRADFRDFGRWASYMILTEDPEKIRAVQILQRPLSKLSALRGRDRPELPTHEYPYIGHRNFQLKIEEFVHQYLHLLDNLNPDFSRPES